MRKITALMLASGLLATPFHLLLATEQTEVSQPEINENTTTAPFVPFTGKITKNKVRMRIQPNLSGAIVRELSKDQLVIVLGEDEDYYAIRPPVDIKTYVYRTFVLDGNVEGKNVNVRLEPDTESPVLAQLNTGDHIVGEISPINSKWLEIAPPADVRFYVFKEYIEKIGDPSMMAKMERRRNEVNQLLESSYTVSRAEMQKPFNEINLDYVTANLTKIQNEYSDFHDQSGRAKTLELELKEAYLEKKLNHLKNYAPQHHEVADSLVDVEVTTPVFTFSVGEPQNNTPSNESIWTPAEKTFYNEWLAQRGAGTIEDFYDDEQSRAVSLRGIVEAYNRPVKNKPGNYMLVNSINKLPIAYIYSTNIDLAKYEEQEVTLKAAPRPNNNFAFPAYFVLSVE